VTACAHVALEAYYNVFIMMYISITIWYSGIIILIQIEDVYTTIYTLYIQFVQNVPCRSRFLPSAVSVLLDLRLLCRSIFPVSSVFPILLSRFITTFVTIFSEVSFVLFHQFPASKFHREKRSHVGILHLFQDAFLQVQVGPFHRIA